MSASLFPLAGEFAPTWGNPAERSQAKPIANHLGVDSIHYAMVFILSIGVGVFMPPVGIGFYIACAVVRADIDKASRSMVPYLVVLCIGILLIAYVPWFTHALPNLVGR